MHKNINSTTLVRFPAKFSSKCILIYIYIKSISKYLRWCSVKQSTWGKSGDKELINSSDLFNRPLIFWWNTEKLVSISCEIIDLCWCPAIKNRLVVGSLLACLDSNLSSFCSWSLFACCSWIIRSSSLSTLLFTVLAPSRFCSSFQLIFMGPFFCSLKISFIELTVVFASCSFPFLFRWRPCLVKWSLSEVTFTVVAFWKLFICLSSFLLKAFTSLLTQECASRSNLLGTLTTRILVWLCLSTNSLIWPRPFWDSFLLISLVPPHTTTASCFVKAPVSLTVCVIAARPDPGFTVPWISKSCRLSWISEAIPRAPISYD